MINWHRLLVLAHRYIGIGLGLLFVVWFVSAFVIMYTGGMPSLTDAERLQHQTNLQLFEVRVTPQHAQLLTQRSDAPVLRMVMGRPAYQYAAGRGPTVFADDGSFLRQNQVSSRDIVAGFFDIDTDLVERVGRVDEVDQWTLTIRNELPLEKFVLNDADRTEVYVSQQRGQVVLETTARDRFLAWIGAIPHWLYFTSMRAHTETWSATVIILSGVGTVMAVLGIVLIFTQWLRVRPFRLTDAIPYKGLMRWHYIAGLLFGLVTLTWVFSGLLSMDPYRVYERPMLALPSDALQDGVLDLDAFNAVTSMEVGTALAGLSSGRNLKEVRFKRSLGQEYYELLVSDEESSWGFTTLFIDAATLEPKTEFYSPQQIVERVQAVVTGYEVTESRELSSYGSYYYSRPNGDYATPPLPALEMRFDDPGGTWVYADLFKGELVYRIHRVGRVQRWLYNGLHSLNFRFWYANRPIWDIGVIVLLTGGLTLCGLGTFLGFRRMYRNLMRWFRNRAVASQ